MDRAKRVIEYEVITAQGRRFIWSAHEPYTEEDCRRSVDYFGHVVASIKPWMEVRGR